MKRRVQRNAAGVTLLELMFASGVLAVSLAMLFGALVSINVLGGVSEERAVAASEIAGVLEHLRTLDYADLVAYQLPWSVTEPGTERALVVECFDADGGSLTLPLSVPEGEDPPVLPNPLEVKVTLLWANENGRAHVMSASTEIGR